MGTGVRKITVGGYNMASRNTILIADDFLVNRQLLKIIFQEQFEIIEAENGAEAITLLTRWQDEIALMFLDLQMPVKSGIEVLQFMEEEGIDKLIPVIVITGEATDETDEKVYELGASDIIYKPFAPKVVMRRAMNIMELFAHRIDLENALIERTKELYASQRKLERFNSFLVTSISSVAEFRSFESDEHINRVKYFTKIILGYLRKQYPKYEFTLEQMKQIVDASAMHDIGKISIPDRILLKPDKLTKEEYEIMKTHTTNGAKLIEGFIAESEDNDMFYHYCYDICKYHHERYDGGGYPEGLVGDAIPIWAQVVSIAHTYDNLISKRIYKVPYVVDEAARMINAGECGVFSPEVLDCFNLAKEELFRATEDENFSFADA